MDHGQHKEICYARHADLRHEWERHPDGHKVFGLGGSDVLTSRFNDTRLFGGWDDDRLTTEVTRIAEPYGHVAVLAWQYGGGGDDYLSAISTAV
jgi:hypothetical protein